MEFTNEIFFNKPLIAESTVIITYSGQLYREHSKDVSIVFGYGDNWDETDNAVMVETDNGFEVTLTIKDYSTFNFCFKNSFNIWDNNSGFNYIAPISPKPEDPKDKDTKEQNIIQPTEDSKEELLEDDEEDEIQENDECEAENTANFEKQTDDVEALFSSLLDSILDGTNSENETIDISNLSGFGLQSIDEIKEEDIINCDEIFAELFNELTGDLDNVTTEKVEDTQKSNEPENTVASYENYDAQELDSLMDNLLASIAENCKDEEIASPVQKIESNSDNDDYEYDDDEDLSDENVGMLATIEDGDWVDKIVNFTKKIGTACKRFGSLIKLKVKELGLISDK